MNNIYTKVLLSIFLLAVPQYVISIGKLEKKYITYGVIGVTAGGLAIGGYKLYRYLEQRRIDKKPDKELLEDIYAQYISIYNQVEKPLTLRAHYNIDNKQQLAEYITSCYKVYPFTTYTRWLERMQRNLEQQKVQLKRRVKKIEDKNSGDQVITLLDNYTSCITNVLLLQSDLQLLKADIEQTWQYKIEISCQRDIAARPPIIILH